MIEYLKSKENYVVEKFQFQNMSLNSHIQFSYKFKYYFGLDKKQLKTKDINNLINLDDGFFSKKDMKTVLHYYFPYANNNNTLELFADSFTKAEQLYKDFTLNSLKSIGYNGSIKSGFLMFYAGYGYIVSYTEKDALNDLPYPTTYFNQYFKERSSIFDFDTEPLYSPSIGSSYENENEKFLEALQNELDEEALIKIENIREILNDLKATGKLFYMLPIFKKIIEESEINIKPSKLSTISIDADYRILLPDFNNLEIQLSHLTKAIYILFTRHPQGINVLNMRVYKAELTKLYLSISNQENYDKMEITIDELIGYESKSIYTHISRIKSAFYKVMDKEFADHYVVKSFKFGSPTKYIPLLYINPSE
jgi:hypothetical protein